MSAEQKPGLNNENPLVGKIDDLRRRQKELTHVSEIPGLSAAFINWPADRVSGDGLGIIPKRNPGLFIFDVTGHGPATALDWSMANTALNIFSRMNLSPLEVVHYTEHYLSLLSGENSVPLTALYGEIDTTKGTFEYVHAGHVRPLIYSHESGKIIDIDLSSDPQNSGNGRTINAGMNERYDNEPSEDLNYYGNKTEIKPGDVIILYTDGITEGRNKNGESFGEEKLTALVNDVIESAPQTYTAGDISQAVEVKLKDFYDGTHVEDDCTLMVIVITDKTNGT